jgi:hypothetical protein
MDCGPLISGLVEARHAFIILIHFDWKLASMLTLRWKERRMGQPSLQPSSFDRCSDDFLNFLCSQKEPDNGGIESR